MSILPMLLVAGLSGTAQAADPVGIRLKVNSDLFSIQKSEAEYDGEAVDGTASTTNVINLFTAPPRLEVTYAITPAIEAGIIAGYASFKGGPDDFDGDLYPNTLTRLGVTGSYNLKLGDGLRGYVQPVLLRTSQVSQSGSDTESSTKSLSYGGDLGVRVQLFKRVSLDPAFTFMTGSSRFYDSDGEEVDEKAVGKNTSYGLRLGLGVRI